MDALHVDFLRVFGSCNLGATVRFAVSPFLCTMILPGRAVWVQTRKSELQAVSGVYRGRRWRAIGIEAHFPTTESE
jgi:hypothetical protein